MHSIDIDTKALDCLKESIEFEEANNIYAYVRNAADEISYMISKFDIIVTNPPFGTKEDKGIDLCILQHCIKYLKPKGKIYSFHKTSTIGVLI